MHTELDGIASIPSPARMLQANLEASLDGVGAIDPTERYSPRMVTASVVTLCLAFWMAIYLAAAAIV